MSEHMIFLTHEDRRIKELETENTRLHLEIAQLKGELATYKRGERHVVELREDGWTIQHPLSCRPNLFDCIVNFAAREWEEVRQHPHGRFYCTVDAGDLIIQEEVS
jgi:hypothetical protein